jgi:xanthine/uracil permease
MSNTSADRSLGELFADLSRKTTLLVRQELELAKTEMTEKATEAGKNIGFLIAGGAVLYMGLLFILAAVAILLATVVPDWLAALIVGLVVAVIGLVLVQRGRAALKQTTLKPEKTIESLKEDKEWVQQQVK